MEQPVVEMKGMVKRFGSLTAVDRVDFTLQKGTIHALLGENGAGKSTLMNLLAGLYQPDEGKIRINGEAAVIHSPRDAYDRKIGMVHQHFMLIPKLTVAENIILGLQTRSSPLLNIKDASGQIRELSQRFGIQADPDALVEELTSGEQQRVEILKMLYRNADILILDEPTAVLTPQEVSSLFQVLRKMAGQGFSIILITHKLEEVLSLCDTVDILRDGKKIDSRPASESDRNSLARMMVGREVLLEYDRLSGEQGETVLETKGISAKGSDGRDLLQDISLQVRAGEILGVAGVSGNGQSELAKTCAGLRRADSGSILCSGRDITGTSIAQRIRLGISYIPDDRHALGMFPGMGVADNLVVKQHDRPPFSRRGFRRESAIHSSADKLIDSYNIRTTSRDTSMRSLSGGNQQKAVLARELSVSPQVIIADQPTRGLDVGAIEYIHQLLLEHRRRNAAVLLISTELDEILNLSDRIIVMYAGRITYTCDTDSADIEQIGLAMAGELQ